MRNLTIEGNITVSKFSVIFKIMHLALSTKVSADIINEINKVENNVLFEVVKNPKIEQTILCKNYRREELKIETFCIKL